MSEPRWDVVVTCGGTGGHVLPALALVDALVAAGLDRERIGFVGGRTGIETRLVPPSGTPFVGLAVRGLPRARGVRGSAGKARSLGAMSTAVLRARALLSRHATQVVVGMGGYASLPCVLAAGRRRPVILYESNAVPGLAVRVAARRAATVACAFRSAAERFPNGMHAGFVVRPDLTALDVETRRVERSRACLAYGIEADRTVLAVMGGSQGAVRLNDAVLGLRERWWDRSSVALVHLTGRDAYEDVAAATAQEPAALQYIPIAFEDDMARLYSACDLLVCRSGASTCAEIAATGTPAICVPYPYATDDHQRRNAEELAAAGASRILLDSELDAVSLEEVVESVLVDRDTLAAMAAAAATMGEVDGAEVLAGTVVELLESARTTNRPQEGAAQ